MKVAITSGNGYYSASVIDSNGQAIVTCAANTRLRAMERLSDELMKKARRFENMSEALEVKILRLTAKG